MQFIATNNGANVINISGGWYATRLCNPDAEPRVLSPIEAAAEYAYSHGVIVVAAIGNSSRDLSDDCPPGVDEYIVSYPAYCNDIISVAAVNSDDEKWHVDNITGSNYANWCDVSAPGVDILSTWLRSSEPSGYGIASGTSLSSPYVAGLAGLIKSYAPNAGVDMISSIIIETTDDISIPNQGEDWEGKLGFGRINAFNALDLIESWPSRPTGFLIQQESGHPKLSWDANSEADLIGYNVYRKLPGNSNYINIAFVAKPTTDYTDYGVNWGGGFDPDVCYRVKVVDIIDNESLWSATRCAPFGNPSKITVKEIPINYELEINFPNPFNPITSIRYSLPEKSIVVLKIYDLIGNEIITLINRTENAGYKKVMWDGNDYFGKPVSSGMYLYSLDVFSKNSNKEFHATRKMVLIR